MTEKEKEDFSKKLTELESKLLEQEHRPFTIIKNFFERTKWGKEDPRRKAIKVSFFWRLFFSPGVLAASGGIIAILSLSILVWQTCILIKQNSLITIQNEKIVEQNHLVEAQRRSTLQFEISEILNRISNELKNNESKTLTKELRSRIIAVTLSMRPYRSFENDSLTEPYSYEKGHLFTYLLNSSINLSDLREILSKGNFSYMKLENIVLQNSNPSEDFPYSDINIKNSYLNNVKILGWQFDYIKMNNCIIKNLQSSPPFATHLELQSCVISNSRFMNRNSEDIFEIFMDRTILEDVQFHGIEKQNRTRNLSLKIESKGYNNLILNNRFEYVDLTISSNYASSVKFNKIIYYNNNENNIINVEKNLGHIFFDSFYSNKELTFKNSNKFILKRSLFDFKKDMAKLENPLLSFLDSLSSSNSIKTFPEKYYIYDRQLSDDIN